MDFSAQNNLDLEFYNKDFSEVKELLKRIRHSLVTGVSVKISDLNFEGIIDFISNKTFVYISLFQQGQSVLRWGTCRENFEKTINRAVNQLRINKNFSNFDVKDSEKCRILIEYVTEEKPVQLKNIKVDSFCDERFEPGFTGLKIVMDKTPYYYLPSDAWVYSQMDLKSVLNHILRKTKIKNMTNKISERIEILRKTKHECFIIKSRTFITFKDEVLPLYRGNILYEYSKDTVKSQALAGADWIVNNQKSNGQYLYYYDAKEDNFVDHEHPARAEDDLYYNDLRHCGGVVTLIRAYQLTKDEKYLRAAKKGIEFITTITKVHQVNGKNASYVFYNSKAKLGGTGMILIAMMRYRMVSGDISFDNYICEYTRHLLSRIYKTGEMLGYYINPNVQNGKPLINMSDKERRETFSFYYPGEALLGLALFANYFDCDEELRLEVLQKSEIALDWIVNERPKIYSDLFTSLPSDAWLMQAIEEWATREEFRKEEYLNFVFNDAKTMVEKTYTENDSPYRDYDGAYYYEYGDHFYPDGSRSEGLIAAYYLAKKLGKKNLAEELLAHCRKTAKSQMILFNNEENSFAHKNPSKSLGAIRFKATRQWVRVDSIQHVACFFLRLYFAEENILAP